MKNDKVPKRQEVAWINFVPSKGQEIRGRHPAVVLSNSNYTRLTGLVAVSPITHARNNRLKELFIPVHFRGEAGYINPLQFFTFSCKRRKLQITNESVSSYEYAQLIRIHLDIIN